MAQSKVGRLNSEDFKKWGINALWFCAPALLVLLDSIQTTLPNVFKDPKTAAVFIFLGGRVIDLLRKFLKGK